MDGLLLPHGVEPFPELGAPPRAPVTAPLPLPAPTRPRRALWPRVLALIGLALVVLAALELRFSLLQAGQLKRYAAALDYRVEPGPSAAIVFPRAGPFDERLGYARLPQFLPRLTARNFAIAQQTRFSPALLAHIQRGLFAPYTEKSQAGLRITDASDAPIYAFAYPQRGYASFDAIPPLVVESLLFIENRGLLDPSSPYANPAVDWPRFAGAVAQRAGKLFGVVAHPNGGASTLATQLEKFRHSPDGLTLAGGDKLRQMLSASVRWYQRGEETLAARQAIVREYLNSVPLAAQAGYGEVNGLADGLGAWFGADFAAVNAALDVRTAGAVPLPQRAIALREVLALIIAQRRPSYYLYDGRGALERLTDAHLRLLERGGIIDASLRDAALAASLKFNDDADPKPAIGAGKTTSLARAHLATLLDVPLYALDRLDLDARTTLDAHLQDAVTAHLKHLADPEFARQMGLYGEHLFRAEKPEDVRYTFTLLELRDSGYRVRVQTDNTNQVFDLNEGSKLELGSTAKLRVLTTYLEIVSELHERYGGLSSGALRTLAVHEDDAITRWAVDYLLATPDRKLETMLGAALERHYSASPNESFYTGGGIHTFANFKPEDNGREPTIREAFRESINLPFIRLLHDVVRYTIHDAPGNSAQLLADDRDPRRSEYLAQFADREGTVFLRKFWRRYENKSAEQRVALFLDGLKPGAARLAAAHRYLAPSTTRAEFGQFMRASLPGDDKLTDARLDQLYRDYTPGHYSLTDQAFIAGVHPLELWLVNYRLQRPEARFSDAVAASSAARQEIYGWLFKSRHRSARDNRLATMLEVEAFMDIHRRWQSLGYPFERLVPSLATAIGSSGDRPAALAELMGIIRNDGVRLPTVRVEALAFARGTPYETELGYRGRGTRVMRHEIAATLSGLLGEVVADGTARRLAGTFVRADGSAIAVGGKTGTGDNRVETVDRNGATRDSYALNRTATFVFYLGERWFGTITAYVAGREGADYAFTSALPVQVLKGMAPILEPYLEQQADAAAHVGTTSVATLSSSRRD